MKVEKIIVGSFKENCYILSNQNDVLIIDPGDEPTKIKEAIGNRNILGVLITHKHFDHVGALPFFKEYKDQYTTFVNYMMQTPGIFKAIYSNKKIIDSIIIVSNEFIKVFHGF